MPEGKNYCADCGFHFRDSIESHADTYHNGAIFRGVEDGNYKDYQEQRGFNWWGQP